MAALRTLGRRGAVSFGAMILLASTRGAALAAGAVPVTPSASPIEPLGLAIGLALGVTLGVLATVVIGKARRRRRADAADADERRDALEREDEFRDRIGKQLSTIEAGQRSAAADLASMRARATAAVDDGLSPPPAPIPSAGERVTGTPVSAADAPTPPSTDAATSATACIDPYRAMLAQPTIQAFNSWARTYGAADALVDADGTVRPGGERAAGMLVEVRIGPDRALLFPGGDVVAEFSTRYATLLAARAPLGAAFEMSVDGGGRLALLAPAMAAMADGEWRLAERGHLGGFTG